MNLEKSCLSPSQTATYLGMILVSSSLRAFPTEKRVDAVLKQIEEFLSFMKQSVVTWRCLLGRLSSLCHLVPAGRLRMRSLQLQHRQHWDFVDEDVLVPWNSQIQSDLGWWSDAWHLLSGVSLLIPQPDLLFRPIYFRPLVSRGEGSFHQCSGTAGNQTGPAQISTSHRGSHSWGCRGQHYGLGICQKTGDHLRTPEFRGSSSPSLV